jgi:hypothetical protein
VPEDRAFSLAAIGLCTDKAKVHFWRHETLPLPPVYLHDRDLVQSLKDAIAVAEDVGKALRGSAATVAGLLLAPGGRSPDKKQVWATVDSIAADALYWSRLEQPFRRFLVELPGVAGHQKGEIDSWFRDTLRPVARRSFEETAGQFDRTARAVRALVEGERHLSVHLSKTAREHRIDQPATRGATP